MSTVDERGALDRRMSLFEHATRLHELNPAAPLPRGGRPYPDDDEQLSRPAERPSAAERTAAYLSVLERFFGDPSASVQVLHDDLSRLDLPGWTVESATDKLPAVEAERLRETGVWLVRHGTDRRPVMVGLALLAGCGQPADVALIRTIGLLDFFAPLAVTALAAIVDTALDLIWLAERSERWARIKAVEALCRPADPHAIAWLLRHAVGGEEMGTALARQVAEAVSLADALDVDNVEDEVLDQAGRLLVAMASPNDYRAQVANYRDARRAYRALAPRLAHAAPSTERYAMVVSLIDELRTGHAAWLDWGPGEREDVVAQLSTIVHRAEWRDALVAALRSADPLVQRRAEWARSAIAGAVGPTNDASAVQQIQIVVVAPDPHGPGNVQTRILVDGRPVLAAAFDKGPPFPPETLLARGQLRATAQPHEVRLAEAYCTEGCCGALYVTVVRDGDSVVWRDWRGYTSAAPPSDMRFAAEQYDVELARAEADHGWEWPARTVARLLREALADQPDLLTRWQCQPDWIAARTNEPTQVRFSFFYPRRPKVSSRKPWLQFERVIAVDRTPVAEQVARLVEQLASADPKVQGAVIGGHRDHARQLGYTWPESAW